MKPIVYMLCGLPGSGKTTYSLKLQRETGFKRYSLDEEYFKVVDNKQHEHRDFQLEQQVEEKMKKEIAVMIENGHSLILDYCPWKKNKREEYQTLIESHGGVRKLLYFKIPLEQLKQRAKIRNELKHKDFQFLTDSMLDDFVARFEEPRDEGEEVITPNYEGI